MQGLDTRGLLGWLIDSYGIEERGFMQSVQRLIDASGRDSKILSRPQIAEY